VISKPQKNYVLPVSIRCNEQLV